MMTKMIASPPLWKTRLLQAGRDGHWHGVLFRSQFFGANAHRALARAGQGAMHCVMIRAYCLSGSAAAKVLAMTL